MHVDVIGCCCFEVENKLNSTCCEYHDEPFGRNSCPSLNLERGKEIMRAFQVGRSNLNRVVK